MTLIHTPDDILSSVPLIYQNEYGPTPDEFEFIDNMAAYKPKAKMKPGDLALLRSIEVDPIEDDYPRVWQIRFVVSLYQYHMHEIIHHYPGIGFDHAHDFLPIDEASYKIPKYYAHAFPHGLYPDTCNWFEWFELDRMMIRAPTEEWVPILDEFETPFFGIDTTGMHASFTFDMAPDRYDVAPRRKDPLSFEEGTFHSACLMGMEKMMCAPKEVHTRGYDHNSGLYLP